MTNRHRRQWGGAAVTIVALMGALAGWRVLQRDAGPPAAPALEEVVLAAVVEAKQACARVRVSDCTDPAQAERLLAAARVLGGSSISTENKQLVRKRLAEWLSLRATDDVDAYIEWMESAGNVVSVAAMQGDTLRRRLSKFAAISPTGEARTPQDVVRIMWWLEHDFYDGYLRIRKIGRGPDGAILSFSRLVEGESPHFPGPDDGVDTFWYGFSSICGLSLWDRPTDWKTVVETHGEVIDCLALIVCEGETGRRFPLAVRLFYDPDRAQWWVDSVAINNVEFAGPGLSF